MDKSIKRFLALLTSFAFAFTPVLHVSPTYAADSSVASVVENINDIADDVHDQGRDADQISSENILEDYFDDLSGWTERSIWLDRRCSR